MLSDAESTNLGKGKSKSSLKWKLNLSSKSKVFNFDHYYPNFGRPIMKKPPLLFLWNKKQVKFLLKFSNFPCSCALLKPYYSIVTGNKQRLAIQKPQCLRNSKLSLYKIT